MKLPCGRAASGHPTAPPTRRQMWIAMNPPIEVMLPLFVGASAGAPEDHRRSLLRTRPPDSDCEAIFAPGFAPAVYIEEPEAGLTAPIAAPPGRYPSGH
jgi:hypothetical protein